MSRLYATERGFVVPTMGEELTDRRRARKTIDLPPTNRPGRLFVLAASHPGNAHPLRIVVNGAELPPIQPAGLEYLWYEAAVDATALQSGANTIELWSEAEAMDGWSLAIEFGATTPGSWVSRDAGSSWQSDRIGHLNLGPGEYMVRLRLDEGSDPAPPPFIAGSPDDFAAARLRKVLPAAVLADGDTLERARALATWTSTRWRYRNSGPAAQHAPWDPLTILSWGASEIGHDGRAPVVMCVHYGIVFVAACVAVGIPARPAVFAEAVNRSSGHFAAEVWVESIGRWILVDANEDAIFFDGDRPMTVSEVQDAGKDLGRHVRWGPGHAFQARQPAMRTWIRDVLLTGACFRHRAVWPRSDFSARPELTPPAHGETAYSELDLVWEQSDLDDGFGMFRSFAPPDWFDRPPDNPR